MKKNVFLIAPLILSMVTSPVLAQEVESQQQSDAVSSVVNNATVESKDETKTVVEQPVSEASNELKDAIVNVNVLDQSDEKQPDGSKQKVVIDHARKMSVDFDLTPYREKVKDGDWFDLKLPSPMEGVEGTVDLVESQTNTVIGVAQIKKDIVSTTLVGITNYIKQQNLDGVKDLKGNFFFQWLVKEAVQDKKVEFEVAGGKKITYDITAVPKSTSDYDGENENFAKLHGVTKEESWESPTLNLQGGYLHPWTLRLNTNGTTYKVIRVKDKIKGGHFIPEKFVLKKGYYNLKRVSFHGDVELMKDVDYKVTFFNNYTEFELAIENVNQKAFYLSYASTAPLGGNVVTNTAWMYGDGEQIKPNIKRSFTEYTLDRTSQVTQGGSITLDPWKETRPLDPSKPVLPDPEPDSSSEDNSSSYSEESSESSSETSSVESSESSSESVSNESSESSSEVSSESSEQSSEISSESSSETSSESSEESSEVSSESSSVVSEESSESQQSSESSESSSESTPTPETPKVEKKVEKTPNKELPQTGEEDSTLLAVFLVFLAFVGMGWRNFENK
jgi:cell wall surface anchor family protein, putative